MRKSSFAGETLHALSKRHDISRQLIRIWVGKFEAGALDDDVQAADLIQVKSVTTEREILGVLERPHIAAVTIPSFRDDLAKVLARAQLVAITERIAAFCDPHDDKFLELAVNGRADLIYVSSANPLLRNQRASEFTSVSKSRQVK